ncbi:MAG: hypothetical protein Q4A71_01410 [Actinomycetaceae bacterium]|nr:hypothetical protein [Actinomycetaceae bacterium]
MHYAGNTVAGFVPVGCSDFARDATFGYENSHLRWRVLRPYFSHYFGMALGAATPPPNVLDSCRCYWNYFCKRCKM